MTWQKYYEIYNLYGEEESVWKDYVIKDNKTNNNVKALMEEYPDLQITDYPTLGGIMVFKKIGENYGHVFIVEKLVDSNTIYTSESAWHGKAFFNATRYKSSNWSMSGYEFLGNIVNPTIGDVHWVDPEPPKPVDELKVGDSVEIIGTGKATIYTTIDSSGIKEFDANIIYKFIYKL